MSYLNPLRLHFAGRFQAAPSTVNNDPAHFNNRNFTPRDQKRGPDGKDGWWNPTGDASWRLIGCRVTAAWLGAGKRASNDTVLSCRVADSDRQVGAKIVDLDPMQQAVSMIWGLEVRICSSDGEKTFLRGQFAPAAFTDMWSRGTKSIPDAGAMYQSILSNLEWKHFEQSPFLTALHQTSAKDGLLSIKFNVDGYNMNYMSEDFTMGRIVGTIGPAAAREPRHFVLGRQFLSLYNPTLKDSINFCTAVVDQQEKKILLDLGNALKTSEPGGQLQNLGELSMTCGNPQSPLPLGSIPYLTKGWYEATAGIVEIPVPPEKLSIINAHPLRLHLKGTPAEALDEDTTVKASEAADGLYVRADQFVYRLNPGDKVDVRLVVTHFGQPYGKATIDLKPDISGLQPSVGIPTVGIPTDKLKYPGNVVSDEDGSATFTIYGSDPGYPRRYIDGQVYGIRPKVNMKVKGSILENPWNFISILLFSHFKPQHSPITWWDLQPIFQQYANLYPVMNRFVNLSDYDSVCASLQLLQLAFGLEEKDPNSMPVTRDLSATKRQAILQWLQHLGADGKPLRGEPPTSEALPPEQVDLAPDATVTPSPDTQLASEKYPEGSKLDIADQYLLRYFSMGQS